MLWIILIACLLPFIIYIIVKLKSYNIKLERCILFTGSMGSGKTLTAVNTAIRMRGYQNYVQLRKKIRHPFKYKWHPIYIYSNIPLKPKYYRPLDATHILKKKPMEEGSIVLIDEIGGTLADQYSWQSYCLTLYLSQFVRFSRHWFDGFIVLTDQTSDSVPKAVRDRVACEYHLSNCRTFLFKWKKIDIVPVQHITSETEQVEQHEQEDNSRFKSEYLLTKIPKGIYESRCYRYTYEKGFVFDSKEDIKDNGLLFTRLYLDINPNKEMEKLFKEDKKKLTQQILSQKF